MHQCRVLPALRSALSNKIESLYGMNINPETEITITTGATQAIYTTISAFVNQGDEVIIIEPAYDSYRPSIQINKAIVVPYELEAPDFKINWDKMAHLVSNKTRMIIINTPQNPIGRTLKNEDLIQLESMVSGTDIIVISDEVYEHIVFDGKEHQSVLRFPKLFERCIAVYSFGKTFHSTGWKIGYCVARDHLMKEFRKVHQWNVFSVNSFIQYALSEFLGNKEHYLGLSSFFEKKRDYLLEAISHSRFQPIASEGSYFQLIDYSGISNKNDTEFVKELIVEHGVAAIPVSSFYSSQKQNNLIRLCFAKTEECLTHAAQRLCRI